eukprot:Pgem_evm1s19932
MDGTALYFPCALVFLGMLNGEEITIASYFLIFLLSTLGSIGSAPVPSSQLVLVITAYNTIFGTVGTPDYFGFIILIDWFLDRCATTVNVTGDNMISRIVAGLEGAGLMTDDDDEDDIDVIEKCNNNNMEEGSSELPEEKKDLGLGLGQLESDFCVVVGK